MTDYEVLNDYFCWLCSIIGPDDRYTNLLSYLHSIQFHWNLPMDKNRAMDGHHLRFDYANQNYDIKVIFDRCLPTLCSVFEMFVAISMRCENDIMYDPFTGEDNTGKWFWDALNNMGLLYFDNSRFDIDAVSSIVMGWMAQCYKPDGNGGPYPLRNPDEDMRGVELWGQLSRYLNENYDI